MFSLTANRYYATLDFAVRLSATAIDTGVARVNSRHFWTPTCEFNITGHDDVAALLTGEPTARLGQDRVSRRDRIASVWIISLERSLFHRRGVPVQLYSSTDRLNQPRFGADGKEIFLIHYQDHSELGRYD